MITLRFMSKYGAVVVAVAVVVIVVAITVVNAPVDNKPLGKRPLFLILANVSFGSSRNGEYLHGI